MTKKSFITTILASLLILLILTPFLAAEKDKEDVIDLMSARNTLRINSVSSPAISPDGKWILYTKRERDMESEDLKTTTHIWRVRLDGTQRRQMTHGANNCSSFSFFPYGKDK